VLRTRDHVKPLYVSVGHLLDLPTAERIALSAGAGFRLPEPTRRADRAVAEARRASTEARRASNRCAALAGGTS